MLTEPGSGGLKPGRAEPVATHRWGHVGAALLAYAPVGAAATAAGAPGLAALGAVVAVTVPDVAALLGAGVAAIAGSQALLWSL